MARGDQDQGQAGPDEAASDPTSKSSKPMSASRSFLSMSLAKEVDDETLLADLVDEVKENKTYTSD